NLLLFRGMATEIFIAVFGVEHRLSIATIGAETRDKLGCVALPALQLVVPSSAVTFLPRLLRKDVDGVGCAKELSDPPGRIIRAIGTFRLCAGRDDWVYCHRMRTRIALLDQAR